MGWCKKDITPLLSHCSYAFLALNPSRWSLYWNMANRFTSHSQPMNPGDCFSVKMLSYYYRDSHYEIRQSHYCLNFKMRIPVPDKVDGLMQERHNSIAIALDLCLSCTNPSRWSLYWNMANRFTSHSQPMNPWDCFSVKMLSYYYRDSHHEIIQSHYCLVF